jgi:hypothetical protein
MTAPINETPTPEQAAWDRKSRYYTRNSWIAVGALLALNVGSFIWVVAAKIVPYFSLHVSGNAMSEAASSAAFADFGSGIGLLLAIIMVTGVLSLPLRKAVRTAFWILGSRPADNVEAAAAAQVKTTR